MSGIRTRRAIARVVVVGVAGLVALLCGRAELQAQDVGLDGGGQGSTGQAPPPRPPAARTATPPRAKRPIGFAAFALFDANLMTAKDSFDAVVGTTRFDALGGGGEVKVWRDLFARVTFSQASRDGERVFVVDDEVFPIGIPITIETAPLEVSVGWRFQNAFRRRPRQVPPRPGQPGYAPRGPVTNPAADPNAPRGTGAGTGTTGAGAAGAGQTGTGAGAAGTAGAGAGTQTGAGAQTGTGAGAATGTAGAPAGQGAKPGAPTPPAGQGAKPGAPPPPGQGAKPAPQTAAAAAAAARPPRTVPYVGAGLLLMRYRETSDLAIAGDNVDQSFKGFTVFGGFDVRIAKLLFAGFEAQYRGVPDALGTAGASQAFGETDLGGFTARVLIGIRK